MASISPDAKFLKTNGLVKINNYDFIFRGVISKSLGFCEVHSVFSNAYLFHRL